jgi:LPXTG-motif cell wall-anchored protein
MSEKSYLGVPMRRAFTVLATAAVAVAGLAGPTAAASALPLCSPNDRYIPGDTCEVSVTPECLDGLPVLDYVVGADAVAGAGTVDVTWTNLPVADVVLADQALTVDNMAWPAGADADVTLVFATSPTATRVNVTAPPECDDSLVLAAPPVRTSNTVAAGRAADSAASGVLAATGSTTLPLALGGGALVLGGAALVLARRARQHRI